MAWRTPIKIMLNIPKRIVKIRRDRRAKFAVSLLTMRLGIVIVWLPAPAYESSEYLKRPLMSVPPTTSRITRLIATRKATIVILSFRAKLAKGVISYFWWKATRTEHGSSSYSSLKRSILPAILGSAYSGEVAASALASVIHWVI